MVRNIEFSLRFVVKEGYVLRSKNELITESKFRNGYSYNYENS